MLATICGDLHFRQTTVFWFALLAGYPAPADAAADARLGVLPAALACPPAVRPA
ncbi:MAG: hypothetical protein E7L01_21130 [Paenibacillus macerans]|uniref:Uncharacterized protein n=1 Tax=Paenibacillus macerans TaxID=44252 RepID=A0A6N8EXV5_PAEMA|nr:hypothetical protein [Paenibacillus macerans]MBS5910041.1 hypothetical protein [Paenibacillus macerans]MCY7560160.1 hypothetical protein [Paenibacillus macerans]MDU5950424.1 hypothetical protein [Paenibacillus macerans]MDU7475811.1 hypothetical protein [Paenibacillus macerans]MEC0135532.1 hypothetical protein [Paenibacillus macerans]